MRRKIISLHNISLGFKVFGFAFPIIGTLAGVWMLVNGIRYAQWMTEQARSDSAKSMGSQIERFVIVIYPGISLIMASLVAALTAFMLSELILLFLRMEVDLKQIRFSIADGKGIPATAPTTLAPQVVPPSPQASITSTSDDAIEIDLPAAAIPEPAPVKPAMDLYAERDKDVPFDILITPKGDAANREEEETTDSSPEMPVFETHEEETPKVDTRPISYCPSCNAMIRYKPEKKGKVIKCPKCTQPFRIGVS
jgi:hypothetical protein